MVVSNIVLQLLVSIGDKVSVDNFKDKNTTFITENDRLKFSQDVAMNHFREKWRLKWKISYKVFEEKYGYDTLIEISPHPKLIKFTYFHGCIKHCVTVVGRWIFDSNITFVLPLSWYELE